MVWQRCQRNASPRAVEPPPDSLRASRGADGFISVKGISDREVRADVAIWPLRVVSRSITA